MFLNQSQYQSPGDYRDGPFQYAYETKLSVYEWLGQNPLALARFNTFMEGTRAYLGHWAEWFPVQVRLIDGALCDGRKPFLVDIAGGRGQDLIGLKLRYPQLPGPLVLEEMPWVIDENQSLDSDIQRVKHDFFTPQPVKGMPEKRPLLQVQLSFVLTLASRSTCLLPEVHSSRLL